MLLTSKLLLSSLPEEKIPRICISLLNETLQVKCLSRDGLFYGISEYPIFGEYLLLNVPSPIYKQEANIQQLSSLLWNIEKAFKCIRLKDWESFGKNIDNAFLSERECIEPNIICDLAYTTARSIGAFGGYSSENKLFLVCPIQKSDIIKVEVENAIRNISKKSL